MERLPFVLPDFTRATWVSDDARAVWEPRLGQITRAWLDIEWLAIVAGVRRCAITMVSPEGLLEKAPRWVERGLSNVPLELQGVASSLYAATPVRTELGKAFMFRAAVGAPSDLAAFKRAWDAADDVAIGGLLGYPDCCRTFFRRVWVEDAMVDTTWPMALASASDATRELDVAGPPEANILWRWMGLRPVPHLPCRVDCPSTVALAGRFDAVGREHGFSTEMDWLREILRWPVEWSALHGIAEIRTPILKVSARTDATASRYVVRRGGDRYPSEGARGLRFPFLTPARPQLTSRPAFRRGLAQAPPSPAEIAEAPWYAGDNGFGSREVMENAHRPIVDLAAATLAGVRGPIIDLGCGNGALLASIVGRGAGLEPVGVDLDPERIGHARRLLPEHGASFVAADLFESPAPWPEGRRYALALLMPGRLVEAGPGRARRLKARLAAHCDRVLVYAYGEWLERYGGLRALAAAAGLPLAEPIGATVAPLDLDRLREALASATGGDARLRDDVS